MAVNRTVRIKNYLNIFEEYAAGGAITPGHLIKLNSAGAVVVHATAGGPVLPMFALEDELQGKTIDDAYASDDRVQCWIPQRGDVVNAILADGQNIAIGDFLESTGDGTLTKWTADVNDSDESDNIQQNQIVGIATEAVDLSGSSGTHPTTGLRIKVRII